MPNIKNFSKHIIIFTILSILSYYSVAYFFQNQKSNYLKVQTQLIQSKYETQYNYLKIMSQDIQSMYQENEKVIKLFEQAYDANLTQRALIRNKMHTMLKKKYKRLTNMGLIERPKGRSRGYVISSRGCEYMKKHHCG